MGKLRRPTPEWLPQIRLIFHYDQETGKLYKRHGDNLRECKARANGYLYSKVLGRVEAVHRLAWAWVTGEWADLLDHINRDGYDNRMSNLRKVTQVENGLNRTFYKPRLAPPYMEIKKPAKRNPWYTAVLRINGKQTIGKLATKQEAVNFAWDYYNNNQQLWPEIARGQTPTSHTFA